MCVVGSFYVFFSSKSKARKTNNTLSLSGNDACLASEVQQQQDTFNIVKFSFPPRGIVSTRPLPEV